MIIKQIKIKKTFIVKVLIIKSNKYLKLPSYFSYFVDKGIKIREFVYSPDMIGLRFGIGEIVTELCFNGLKLISPRVLNLS